MLPAARLQNILSGKNCQSRSTKPSPATSPRAGSRAPSPSRRPPIVIPPPRPPTNPLTLSSSTAGLNQRIHEVLRHIEPVKDAAAKIQASCAAAATTDPSQLIKTLKALLFKIDYVEEGLLTLVEELPPTRSADTEPRPSMDQTPQPIVPKIPAKLFADIRSRRSDASDMGSNISSTTAASQPKPQPPPPPPQSKKAPPPAKKAPPPAKKPPPTPGGKKPPPSKAAPSVPKLALEELTKIDSDLMPETLPNKSRSAKPIQWQGLPREKTAGSVWEDLLKKDRSLMTVREWRSKFELSIAPFPDSNFGRDVLNASPTSGPLSLPFLGNKDDGAITERQQRSAERSSPGGPPPDFRFEVEFKALDDLFFEEEDKKLKSEEKKASLAEAAAAAAKRRLYSVLEEKRTHNVEISLKGLGLRDDFTPIRNAIIHLQFGDTSDPDPSPESSTEGLVNRRRGLKAEDLSLLLGLYPKEEDEIKKLRRLIDDPPPDQKIAPAERFLLCLLEIPRFKPRVEAILSQLTFRSDVVVALEKSARLFTVTEIALQSLTSGILRAVLALIVKMGNYINCMTKKPVVAGIPASALESLKSVKSVDGTKTFIRVVADHIDDQYPSGWRQLEWLEKSGEAADLNIDDLSTMCKSLQTKIDKIKSEMEYATTQKDQKFIQTFGPFLEEAQGRVDFLRQKLTDINQRLMSLAKLFADRAKTPKEAQEILRKLDHFGKDLFKAKREIDAERAAAERKRMRESLKDRTPLASRPSKTAANPPRLRKAKAAEDTPFSPPEKSNESLCSTPLETSPPVLRTRPTFHRRTGSRSTDGGVTPAIPLRHHRSSVGRNNEEQDSPPFTLKRALNVPPTKSDVEPLGMKVAPKTRPHKQPGFIPGQGFMHDSAQLTMSMTDMGSTPTSDRRRLVKQSPSIISGEPPRVSSLVETESTATDALRAKHKKSRSHALHKSVCSIQESLNVSPKNQCNLPLNQVPSFIAEDARVLREVKSYRQGGTTTSKRHSTGARLLTGLESQPTRSNEPMTSPRWVGEYEDAGPYPEFYEQCPPATSVSARGHPPQMSPDVLFDRPGSHRSTRTRQPPHYVSGAYDEDWEELRRAEELARRSTWRQQQMYYDARQLHYVRSGRLPQIEHPDRPSVTGWPLYRDVRR